jgi:hypothetical protein
MNAAKTYRSAVGRVTATLTPAMFLTDRLLNCAAALDSFDRKRNGTKNTPLRTRIQRCVQLAGPYFEAWVGNVDAWLDVIRDARDDVAHNYDWRTSEPIQSTYFLWRSLYWLFCLCILREAQAPDAVFDRIVAHEQWRWLGRKIQAEVTR